MIRATKDIYIDESIISPERNKINKEAPLSYSFDETIIIS